MYKFKFVIKLKNQNVKKELYINKTLNERIAFAPPESDCTLKYKPFRKDDPDNDMGGNPGIGPNIQSVEIHYLFINNNYLSNQPILNNFYYDQDKSFKYFLFSPKNYIRPIHAQSHFNYKNQLNNLNFNKNNNLNNNLNYNLDSNLDSNSNSYLEKEIDITIINSPIENDINNKLVTIISNNGTSVSSSSVITNNIYKNIIESKLNESSKLIKPSEVIKINKTLNNDLHSYPIKDIEIERSLYESEQKLELIKLRKALHSEWLNSHFKSHPLTDQDINEFLMEEEQVINIKAVNELDFMQQPMYLVNKDLVNKDLVNYNINLNKTNHSLYLNDNVLNVTKIFISHKLYVDFIYLIFCEIFFVNEIINLNFSCFIYGFIFVPKLFILNSFGFIITSIIFISTFYLINNGFEIILKNSLSYKNYIFIKNILNKSYSMLVNGIFLYILLMNMSNISLVSNLLLLKVINLSGQGLLTDLKKYNNKNSNQFIIDKCIMLNPYIYKEYLSL